MIGLPGSSALNRQALARIFHELIWSQMQGAGHEAVGNLLRMSRNIAVSAVVCLDGCAETGSASE